MKDGFLFLMENMPESGITHFLRVKNGKIDFEKGKELQRVLPLLSVRRREMIRYILKNSIGG